MKRLPRGTHMLAATLELRGYISAESLARKLRAIARNRNLNPRVRAQAAATAGRINGQVRRRAYDR